MDDLFNYFNPATQSSSPMISAETHSIIQSHADELNSAIIYDRDYAYNYFGFKVPHRDSRTGPWLVLSAAQ